MSIQYRSEHDSVGERSVPKDVYYGVQSLRAAENFPITGLAVHPEQINSIAEIKKASAITNLEIGLLDKRVADAIVRACDEIAAGRLHEAFIVDPIQGGAGTSLNMNANEVIANRAIELLGGEKGDYALVNPNDHVNYGQSTNDVFPSAGKLAVLKLLVRAQIQLERLSEALEAKAEEFDDVLKMGRTQMQDAVPIRLGQEFRAYSRAVRRDIARFERAKDEMRRLNMGGTAIGTGINADERYLRRIIPNLSKVTGLELVQAFDLIDATQNLDGLVAVSGAVKTCAVNLSKMSNDLRLMSSGPRCGFSEINLPPRRGLPLCGARRRPPVGAQAGALRTALPQPGGGRPLRGLLLRAGGAGGGGGGRGGGGAARPVPDDPLLLEDPQGGGGAAGRPGRSAGTGPVSYTHLTLPTTERV